MTNVRQFHKTWTTRPPDCGLCSFRAQNVFGPKPTLHIFVPVSPLAVLGSHRPIPLDTGKNYRTRGRRIMELVKVESHPRRSNSQISVHLVDEAAHEPSRELGPATSFLARTRAYTRREKSTTPSRPPNSLGAVIHMQVRLKRDSLVGCSPPFMRLAEHLTALGVSNVCLVGENSTCSVPALQGCQSLMVICLRSCITMTTPPLSQRHYDQIETH